MLIQLKNEGKQTLGRLSRWGVSHVALIKEGQMIVGLEKSLTAVQQTELLETGEIAKIHPIHTPYKLASRAFQPKTTVIRIGDVEIGGEGIVLIAGPCAIESEEQLLRTAEGLKKCGVSIMRASAFKPRSSPYSFQGLGLEGLQMHRRAQEKHGLLTETEVMDPRDVPITAEHVDILRIGARNMQNYDLLKAVAKSGKPVILKRGLSATVEEWLMSAEYILAHGNPNVILCERGIRTFEPSTRNTLDLSSVAVAKLLTHLPILVDPSHAAGRKDILGVLSNASIALGADGLLIEVHPEPEQSVCDAKQALSFKEFAEMLPHWRSIASAIGRML